MRQKISKKEIWRNTTSAFVRGMFGFRVFCMYLGCVIAVFFIPKFSMLVDSCIEVLHNKICEDDFKLFYGYSLQQLSTFAETYRAVLVGFAVFGLFLRVGITLWYHLGRSRCLTAVFFVMDVMVCMLYVYLMCSFPIEHPIIILSFILILFFTFVDFLIMKSVFRYRKRLEEAIFQYNEELRKNTGYNRYIPEYQINKPKLDLSYHSVDDRQGVMEHKIAIDEYVKDRTQKGKSVYQKQENDLAEAPAQMYEEENGVKVDTSLGYPRITFEDPE